MVALGESHTAGACAAAEERRWVNVTADNLTLEAGTGESALVTVTVTSVSGTPMPGHLSNLSFGYGGPGAFSVYQDNGDGTYTGILTAETVTGQANLTAQLTQPTGYMESGYVLIDIVDTALPVGHVPFLRLDHALRQFGNRVRDLAEVGVPGRIHGRGVLLPVPVDVLDV